MLYRPLILVLALVAGDYALWTWSVAGNHDVTAMVSGLALAPLSIALAWLLAINVLRALGRAARVPARPVAALRTLGRAARVPARPVAALRTRAGGRLPRRRRRSATMAGAHPEDPAKAASGSASSSTKIAA